MLRFTAEDCDKIYFSFYFNVQEIEEQLKIKKRQQSVEIRKTTAELRDTDARYSAQKSKVNALEKENAW